MNNSVIKTPKKGLIFLIIVASLGYFVDIYDLILFQIIKEESMKALNIGQEFETTLFNFQMSGMLIGGLLWGIWGDKKGRVSVLFGSILLYSIANIANAFVTTLDGYKFWRLIAGVGLAGELGAAITLVSETMPKRKRGIGTMIIVTFGALGAIFAYFVSEEGAWLGQILTYFGSGPLSNWQLAYIMGGLLGLFLLVLRAGTFESGMFKELKKEDHIKKGNFFQLFTHKKTFLKYLACICIGLPVWYVVGILIALAHRFIPELNIIEEISTKECIMWSYVGLSSGDLLSGLLSQWLKSRKKVIYFNLIGISVLTLVFLFNKQASALEFKLNCFALGLFTGYWALFVTNASEQFGTNIRSTVTATVPNFVRGANVPISLGFVLLSNELMPFGNTYAALIVGFICIGLSAISVWYVPESFHKDLNYYEK